MEREQMRELGNGMMDWRAIDHLNPKGIGYDGAEIQHSPGILSKGRFAEFLSSRCQGFCYRVTARKRRDMR